MNSHDMLYIFNYAKGKYVAEANETVAARKKPRKIMPLLAAALVIGALGVTAFAVAREYGILNILKKYGAEDTPALETMVVTQPTVPQADIPSTDYASFQVTQTLFDGNSLMVELKAAPTSPEYFLIPATMIELTDSVAVLDMDGITQGTIGDYVVSLKKTPVRVSANLQLDDSVGSPAVITKNTPEGEIYFYLNTSLVDNTGISSLSGTVQTTTVTFEEGAKLPVIPQDPKYRLSFPVELQNKGQSGDALREITQFPQEIETELGCRIQSIRFEKRELGIYAYITYTPKNPEESFAFNFLHEPEDWLRGQVSVMDSHTDNPDGSRTYTTCYLPDSDLSNLTVSIVDNNLEKHRYFIG